MHTVETGSTVLLGDLATSAMRSRPIRVASCQHAYQAHYVAEIDPLRP